MVVDVIVGLIFLSLPALSMANAGFRARSFGKMQLGAKVDERLFVSRVA